MDPDTHDTSETTMELETPQVDEQAGDAEGSDDQEVRSYSEDELQARVREATSAVQSAKDRRIAALEVQIKQMQADMPMPTFRNAEEELAWHRGQRDQARAIRSTETKIATALGELSDKVGVEIKRDDPRIDIRTAESFEASLAAIAREEELRKQIPGKKPAKAATPGQTRRNDTHRFDGGSGGARQTYNPKTFENTGNVFEALQAKRAAGLR